MKKAVFAGAFALAMVGQFFVSELGITSGGGAAHAQEMVLTQGHINRLKHALRLTPDQMRYWRPVEAALRAAIRSQRNEDGGTATKFGIQAQAYQRVASAAGPLIARLDESQKREGLSVIRSLGVASMF
jgi:hypothetical protein